jgi:hypothetical protein
MIRWNIRLGIGRSLDHSRRASLQGFQLLGSLGDFNLHRLSLFQNGLLQAGSLHHNIFQNLSFQNLVFQNLGLLNLERRGRWHFQAIRQILRGSCEPHGGLDHFAETLHRRDIACAERIRFSGKKFKDSQHLVVVDDWHHYHGRNSHLAAHVAIYPDIALGVVAAQRLPRPHAFPGKSEFRRKQRAQFRSG